jgi:hypothetical protein
MTAHELAMKMIRNVLATTGITATAGIGTNMYLAKPRKTDGIEFEIHPCPTKVRESRHRLYFP